MWKKLTLISYKEKEKEIIFMKEKYETPVCEIIEFETEDVITSSGVGDGGIEII